MRPRRLKLGTHMDSGQMYHVYQNQAAAAYSSLYSFFFLSNFQHWNFSSHFSWELWGLEDWNLVHTWTVGRCIMYTRIRLLLLIRLFIFLSLQFSTLKFLSHFSRELRPRRLKIGTLVDKGSIYHVYHIQAAAAYSSLYFFIFLFLQFSNIKIFVTLFSGTARPRRLKLGTNVDCGLMCRLYWNQASAAYSSHYFIIFLFLQLSNMKNFWHIFLRNCEVWKIETWYTWIVGTCIVYTGIRLLLICPFISSFSFSPIFKH